MVPKIDLRFGERAKRLFARVPLTQRAVRVVTDAIYEFMIYIAVCTTGTSAGSTSPRPTWRKMHRFASIRDKELRRKLTPDYDFGCKRPTFSNGYYRAFTKPHVHLQTDGIDRIEPDGIVNADGTKTVDRHPGAGHRIRPVGGQLPGHRGHRPRRAATSESGGATPGSRPTRACRCRTSRTS